LYILFIYKYSFSITDQNYGKLKEGIQRALLKHFSTLSYAQDAPILRTGIKA